jgi:hypothetical protein
MIISRWMRPGIALMLLVLSSCAPRPTGVLLDTDRVSVADVIGLVKASNSRLLSLTGRGNVTFESSEAAGSAYFTLALRKPDSLLVKLKGPFGIDLGFLFATRERFLVYNSFENKVVDGRPDAATIRSMIPLALTYEQILEAFSGAFPIEGTAADVRTYTIDEGRFRLVLVSGTDTCSYWVDPETLLVTRYARRDARGAHLIEAETGSVMEQEGVFVPRKISIAFPSVSRRVAVFYTTMTVNDPAPRFVFALPPDARSTKR